MEKMVPTFWFHVLRNFENFAQILISCFAKFCENRGKFCKNIAKLRKRKFSQPVKSLPCTTHFQNVLFLFSCAYFWNNSILVPSGKLRLVIFQCVNITTDSAELGFFSLLFSPCKKSFKFRFKHFWVLRTKT